MARVVVAVSLTRREKQSSVLWQQTKYHSVTGHWIRDNEWILHQENSTERSSKQWRRTSIVLPVIESSLPCSSRRPSNARSSPLLVFSLFSSLQTYRALSLPPLTHNFLVSTLLVSPPPPLDYFGPGLEG